MTEIDKVFMFRRGTPEEWAAKNPVLRQGEPGFEKGTGRLKIGNGVDVWSELEYFTPGRDDETSSAEMLQHVNSATPHPVYDDGPSLVLLYQNAKV